MTLGSTTSSVTVLGDGLTSTFSYPFFMGGSDAYAVLIFTDATGATSSITASAFSVTGVNNASGGTFTYPLVGSPISNGTHLTLYRTVPLVQTATIEDQGNFAPVIVDGAMDYEMMAIQQLQREIDTLNSLANSFLTGSISSVTTGMIANQAVTYPKFQNVAAQKLLGNPTTASTTVSEISIDSTLTFSGATLGVAGTVGTNGMFYITSAIANNVQSVTFSSIPTSFTDLQVRVRGRFTTTSVDTNLQVRLNGDTESNYESCKGYFAGVGTSVGSSLGATSWAIGGLPGAGATTSFAGLQILDIGNYKDTTFFKAFSAHGGYSFNESPGNTNFNGAGGLWKSTASITSITIFPTSGSFATGSFVSLYGIL